MFVIYLNIVIFFCKDSVWRVSDRFVGSGLK